MRAVDRPPGLEIVPKDATREQRNYPVQVLRIGNDVTIITLASEVVVDYSLRLKRELARPPGIAWVAGYSNGYFGYIPSERVLAEGGDERPAYAPGIEERIVGKAKELCQQLTDPAAKDSTAK